MKIHSTDINYNPKTDEYDINFEQIGYLFGTPIFVPSNIPIRQKESLLYYLSGKSLLNLNATVFRL